MAAFEQSTTRSPSQRGPSILRKTDGLDYPKMEASQTGSYVRTHLTNTPNSSDSSLIFPNILPSLESRVTPANPKLTPAYLSEPCLGRPLSPSEHAPFPALVSMAELSHSVGAVGTQLARRDAVWREGLGLMAATLGVDIPIQTVPADIQKSERISEETPNLIRLPDKRASGKSEKSQHVGITGSEVSELLVKNRRLGKVQFVHLNIKEKCAYRPYDLQVAPESQVDPEHYIFSPFSVLHVQPDHSSELMTLGEWHRDSVLWRALQEIPFFRKFLLRKTFIKWHTNVRHLCLLKRRDYLQRTHLLAVPQFGAALLQFSRLIEELKRVHWLPVDDSQSYTLIQFQGALYRKNHEARGRLEKFLQYRTIILNMVQDDSYKVFQDLQTQFEKAKSGFGTQSISLQHTQQIEVYKSLQEAKIILERLGDMASLADHMIIQNLVTIAQREVTTFIKKVMQEGQLDRRSLFQAHLVFDSDSQLTLFPSAHLFADTLLGALKSVADSALQVFDFFNNTSDNQDTETENKPAGNWSSPQWDTCFKGLGDTDSELSDIMVPKLVSHLHSKVSKEPRLIFSQLGAVRVSGHQVKGQYYTLCREKLEWNLLLHGGVQEAERKLHEITEALSRSLNKSIKRWPWRCLRFLQQLIQQAARTFILLRSRLGGP
ncbi:dynein heavy chain domain-containing protein 1-like [Polyodon spathula]|uniref:dynein heavy chain domain-containing protein 1-like n=1 Tax=Polyodon spathula TaxID=7913 RepID=UPI001B7E6D72|nr:dynein heavy chain domain-containing protein 1-like [Polyodon spathula]